IPFLPNVTTDMVGAAMVGGIGVVAGVHAVGMGIRFKRRARIARGEALAAAEGVAVAEAVEGLPPDGEPAEDQAAGTEESAAIEGDEPAGTGER
ncbi:MAG TPA: hypothetical protein VES19_11325, partial [Candidatus Limnocylindrales bacterium]|nr:hypothetical protein [Candidatus Limnocylindrales bacterium]